MIERRLESEGWIRLDRAVYALPSHQFTLGTPGHGRDTCRAGFGVVGRGCGRCFMPSMDSHVVVWRSRSLGTERPSRSWRPCAGVTSRKPRPSTAFHASPLHTPCSASPARCSRAGSMRPSTTFWDGGRSRWPSCRTASRLGAASTTRRRCAATDPRCPRVTRSYLRRRRWSACCVIVGRRPPTT